MKQWQRLVLGLAMAGIPAAASAQTSVGFEGIEPAGCLAAFGFVPNGYAGFNWTNFVYVNRCNLPPQYGTNAGTVSGDYSGANFWSAATMYKTSGTFSLGSAYMTAFLQPGQTGLVTGYNGNTLLFSRLVTLGTSPTLVNFGWSGLTSVTFEDDGMPIVVDDIKTDVAPEPATLLLLGSGLTGVGGVLRRRRRSA